MAVLVLQTLNNVADGGISISRRLRIAHHFTGFGAELREVHTVPAIIMLPDEMESIIKIAPGMERFCPLLCSTAESKALKEQVC